MAELQLERNPIVALLPQAQARVSGLRRAASPEVKKGSKPTHIPQGRPSWEEAQGESHPEHENPEKEESA
jgi:hypothetical protein